MTGREAIRDRDKKDGPGPPIIEPTQPGLGEEFYDDLMATMARLPLNPLIHRVRFSPLQARWVFSNRFPYRVIFRVENDTVVVYAVLHAARHDRQWKRRI